MDGNVPSSEPAVDELPKDLIDALEPLETDALEAVRTYVHRRLAAERVPLSELIRSTDDDVVAVEDCGGSALVRKRSPAVDDGDPPREGVLELYRVTREGRPSGETRLHWTYLGDVRDGS
jgi:hypothetical protein